MNSKICQEKISSNQEMSGFERMYGSKLQLVLFSFSMTAFLEYRHEITQLIHPLLLCFLSFCSFMVYLLHHGLPDDKKFIPKKIYFLLQFLSAIFILIAADYFNELIGISVPN